MLYPARWNKITVDQRKVLISRLFRLLVYTPYMEFWQVSESPPPPPLSTLSGLTRHHGLHAILRYPRCKILRMPLISSIYTERQKKLITSSEGRSIKYTLKIIICGHRYKSTPYEAHLKIQRDALFCQKGAKCGGIAKSHFFFFKNHRNCSLRTSKRQYIAIH